MTKAAREIRLRIPESLACELAILGESLYPGAPISAVAREALAAFVASDPLAAVGFAIREEIRSSLSLVARTGLAAALRRIADELAVEEELIRAGHIGR